MEFRIADTFTDSLAKLTGQEQKAVKTTASDLQLNPTSSGMCFHKLDRAKDPNFSPVSVNMELQSNEALLHKQYEKGDKISSTEKPYPRTRL